MTCSFSKEFSINSYTAVENVFLCEYLPNASSDAVKVYLYGLFLCQNTDFDLSIKDIATTLAMSETDVINCFKFWEDFGICSIISNEPFAVQYLPIKTTAGAKPRKYKAEKYSDFAKTIQAIIPSRMISTSEFTEYFSIMETYSIHADAMLMIVKYCVDKKGNDIGYRYISKVAKDFGNRGIITKDKVEKELSNYVLRSNDILKILSSLKLTRQPDIEDHNYLKKWTNELSFELDSIIYAGSKLKKGSFEKLDAFLIELYGVKCFSKEEIASYLSSKKNIYDLAVKINKNLSIYVDIIDTVVDTYTKKWLSLGFTDDALLYIASYCFKIGKNSLSFMDEFLQSLAEKGYIDLSSINDYFEGIKKQDEFISKMLLTAGINRRPIDYDRSNVSLWKSWNFSEEMILEASKLACGKSTPIPYINGILSNWKNKGFFNISDVAITSPISSENSSENYNREYERRRSIATLKAQKNLTNALDIDGFSTIYARLNSIEKDLAFAEIAHNVDLIKSLENEKNSLMENATNLLKTIGLTYQDLSPNYACKKCNDTGYVGTHRCDCFELKV